MKKAFTIIELVFAIVIIGILASVAIPKLGSTVNMAYLAKGKNTLASVRSALATERQKLILKGEFGTIVKLRNGTTGVFTNFVYKNSSNNDTNGSKVLTYDVESCTHTGCWNTTDGITYTFYKEGTNCTFALANNKFNPSSSTTCTELTQ